MDCAVATAAGKLRLDINFGDPVTSGPVLIDVPALRQGQPSIRVLGYPLETVLAEKIATAIALRGVSVLARRAVSPSLAPIRPRLGLRRRAPYSTRFPRNIRGRVQLPDGLGVVEFERGLGQPHARRQVELAWGSHSGLVGVVHDHRDVHPVGDVKFGEQA